MKDRLMKMALVLLTLLVTIQFFQPSRNQSVAIKDTDIAKLYTVPQNVKAILQTSCYDCHSNNTRYPWYSRIQPGHGIWHSILKKERELDFSNFGDYSLRKQRSKFRSMSEQIEKGEMPLSSYTLIHRNAILTQDKKQILIEWLKMADSLK